MSKKFSIQENPAEFLGWISKQQGFKTLDVTDRFKEIHAYVTEPLWRFPEAARIYRYLIIPGLFTGAYPGYMEGVTKHLEQRNLDFGLALIDTSGSVLKNAQRISEMLMAGSGDKKTVLIGHSKGGCDLVAAICKFPQVVPRIRAVVCMQAPVGGSPVPADIFDGGLISFITGVLNPFDPNALKDLSYTSRQEFWKDTSPFPVSEIPTLCFATHIEKGVSLMLPTCQHILEKYCSFNDGLVALNDAVLPSSASVIIHGLDHGNAAFELKSHAYFKPASIMEALILTVLELPSDYYKYGADEIRRNHPPVREGEVHLFSKPNFEGDHACTVREVIHSINCYGLSKVCSAKLAPGLALEFYDRDDGTGKLLLCVTSNTEKIDQSNIRSLRIKKL